MKKTVAILLTATMCATLGASLSSCINPLGGSDTTVTAEEWEQAFEFEVSALEFKATYDVGTEDEETINLAFNENTIFFDQFGYKQYMEKSGNEYYFYDEIENDGEIVYTKETSTLRDFLEAKTEMRVLLVSGFDFFEYDSFKYNTETQAYEAEEITIDIDEIIGTNVAIIGTNVSIIMKNNKVVKISYTFMVNEQEIKNCMEFSYDDVNISLPENIVLTRTQWEQAFKFDLPAVNFVATQNVGTENEESHCWKFNEESLYVEDMGVPETYIVKVGDAYYGCGGQLENDEMIYNKYDSTEEEFLEARARVINVLESFFVGFEYDSFKYNTETKVYEAEGVMIDGMATDCSVVIQNNKVVKINFTFIQNEQEIKNCFEFSYDNVEITLPTIAE